MLHDNLSFTFHLARHLKFLNKHLNKTSEVLLDISAIFFSTEFLRQKKDGSFNLPSLTVSQLTNRCPTRART